MESVLICHPRCSTCKKAKAFLRERGISFKERDILEETPTILELKEWISKKDNKIKSFFNTSGMMYRDLNLKEQLKEMNDDEKINLLASNGMLIKRPILITDNLILVGFKLNEWEESLN